MVSARLWSTVELTGGGGGGAAGPRDWKENREKHPRRRRDKPDKNECYRWAERVPERQY